jgi:uncharacterized protein (TIGR00730 family)
MSPGNSGNVETHTVSLADEEGVRAVLEQAILGLWEVVNNLTRLRPSKHERYRVTIFGSARAKEGTFVYEETRRIARSLTELGCSIVTGGGPGLMRAANQGAAEAEGGGQKRSMGIRIQLPFEQGANAFVTQVYEHRTFFTRLHHFVLASDAFIVTPGGIGTVLEAMMIWQLLQVGQLGGTPLVLVGRMWSDLVAWAREHMLDARLDMATRADLALPRCVETAAQAVELIQADHKRWLDVERPARQTPR